MAATRGGGDPSGCRTRKEWEVKIFQGKRNAVIFGLAFLLSAFGYEFMVFVMTVHIYDLTGSAMNVGLFTALTFLPRLFSPYYGSIADRYPRGRIFSVAAMGIALGVFLVAGSKGIVYLHGVCAEPSEDRGRGNLEFPAGVSAGFDEKQWQCLAPW